MAWTRPITSSCSGGATRPSMPGLLHRVLPWRTAVAARPKPSVKRRGSGATPASTWSTSERKCGRSQGDACELAPMGDLVQGDPQPELPRWGNRADARGRRCSARRTRRRHHRHHLPRARGRTARAHGSTSTPARVPSWAPGMPRAAPGKRTRERGRLELFQHRVEKATERCQVRVDPSWAGRPPLPSRRLKRAAAPLPPPPAASAWEVSSAKSFSSWAFVAGSTLTEVDDPAKGLPAPTHVATRSATSQETGLVTSTV